MVLIKSFLAVLVFSAHAQESPKDLEVEVPARDLVSQFYEDETRLDILEQAFKATARGCVDLDSDSLCSQLYYLAIKHPKKEKLIALVEAKLASRCNKNSFAGCEALADLYRAMGKIEKADKLYKEGCDRKEARSCIMLAWDLQKAGKDKEAARYALKSCELDNASCVSLIDDKLFAIPQMDFVLGKVADQCSARKQSSGGTDCLTLGKYYFKTKKFDLSEKFFSEDCKNGNDLGCIMKVGFLRRQDRQVEAERTMKEMCAIKNEFYEIGIKAFKDRVCTGQPTRMPSSEKWDYTKRAFDRLVRD